MIHAYERDPSCRELSVRVVGTGADDQGPYVLLDDTILYPAGGGQPSDHGRLGGQPILEVARVAGEVRHYVETAPASVEPLTLTLDWERRFDHMQQHTGQHLLTAVACDRYAWNTTSFHLGSERCDIELDVADLPAAWLPELEAAVAVEIRAARAVSPLRVGAEDPAALQARSRGLPDGHEGDVRLIEIDGLDSCACGGTHLRNTAEIESLHLLGTERMRGGTRLFWVAGARVRRLLASERERTAALREILGSSDAEMLEVAQSKVERLREAERRVRQLESRLAEASLATLLASPGPLVEAHYDDVDAAFLQQLGRGFAATGEDRLALLTASAPNGDFFLLARGSDCAIDPAQIGPSVAAELEGRGGGRGEIFQGKAGSLKGRDRALAVLAEACA